ncbi:hypothetical protein H6F67_02345 [Microcoleus sp. FACHB-1515]|uniref:hypothetical protein n=1 Tax=Cyanophyceae TaxID=3028117 RepID=UPI00168717D5|nr:hypothetical protein [Microcoleus sp. FACHB-1515]MBD2088701.1 hypothetical protein [Microcoleus sp. FACHB-1515]
MLHSVLIDRASKAHQSFWFWLSLTFAAVYAWLGSRIAFSSAYVVQDDARQHVFWMRRFLDSELFPNDLIADYFQSTAPTGYTAIYQAGAALGIDPLLFSKILPFALALIATAYCFGVALQLLNLPIAAFVSTLLLNQNLWLQDDLVSGIARAFVYPLFLAFLYYLLKHSLIPLLITIALEGLIYPQLVFIMAGVLLLQLIHWENGFKLRRENFRMVAIGLAVAFVVMLPYAIESSPFGPVVTVAEAKTMPEFQAQGRTRLFVPNPWEYWLTEERTGLFRWVMPLCILSLPLLILMWRQPDRFPLIKQVKQIGILGQVAIVSLFMFLAAHAVMFTLYLPSRYSQNTLQMITALSGGIAAIVLLDGLLRLFKNRQAIALLATLALAGILFFSPYLWEFPKQTRVFSIGQYPTLYEFLAAQPKDIMIASVAREADNIPTFAKRSILTSREYSIPYHTGYYGQIYQRTNDLIRAQYSPNRAIVREFIEQYGIDFWLLDRRYAASPIPANNTGEIRITRWLSQFPAAAEVQTGNPFVRRSINRCSVWQQDDLVLLDAQCLIDRE